jgi:uncharacterized membrane protein (DUF4010 family)
LPGDALDFETLQHLAIATAIGLLVGVERGWRERKAGPGMRTAGIRTFTLIGLLGGVFGAIAKTLEEPTAAAIVIAVSILTFSAVFATYRLRELEREKTYGATTVVAAMATFALGVFALFGDELVAAAAGVAMVGVLAAREGMHGWLARITWPELRSAVVLAAMTFIALPIIPDEDYGPFGGINFREIWLLAVILAAVSFVGYAAMKRFGAGRGQLMGAAAGGLVSSTAVNVTAARRAAKQEAPARLLAASSTLATGVSFLRSLALVAILNASVALYAAAPLILGAIVAVAIAFWMMRDDSGGRSKSTIQLRNPFSLREALMLAAIIAVVKFVSSGATEYFGDAGALIAAFFAGIADTDAIAYSMSQLGYDRLTPLVAGLGVVVANASNSLFKVIFGFALGGRDYGLPLTLGMGIPVLAGALAVPFLLAT